MEKIESKVADTLLQSTEKVLIGGNEYTVSPPSIATIVLASKYISELPELHLDKGSVLSEALSVAKDCEGIGRVLAVLVLGARKGREEIAYIRRVPIKGFLGRIGIKRKVVCRRTRIESLSGVILETMQPMEVYRICAQLLQNMQIADFFGLTTFLTEINMLRPTRKVETTASGR